MATLTLTVQASDDDVGSSPAPVDTTIIGVGGVGTAPGPDYGQGWRFRGVTLDGTETLLTVSLRLMKSGAEWKQVDNRWAVVDADDTPAFSASDRPGARPIAPGVVEDRHNLSDAGGVYYDHPRAAADRAALAAAVASVLARPGWASGNALALVGNSEQDAGAFLNDANKAFHAWDSGTAASEPTLVIDYTPAGVPRALPVDVGSGGAAASVWSDWGPNRLGPFANGADLYAVSVDRPANRVRAYRSPDGGQNWTEQDPLDARPCGTAADTRCVDAVRSGTDLLIANALTTTSMNVLRYSMATDTWDAEIAGPTITLTPTAPIRLHLARATNTTDYLVLFYNGATQNVAGTPRQRVKVHQYSVATATWSGPYDAEGSADSPAANTAPGGAVDRHAATTAVGAGSRVHLFWTASTGALRHRIFLPGAAPAFGGAAATLGADAPTDGAVGAACAYANGAATGVAVPYATAAGFKVARCADSTTAATAGNWTVQTVTDRPAERDPATAQAGALAADGPRLFAWEITDAGQELWWSDDGAAGAWPADATPWKLGTEVMCAGVSLLPGGEAVGVLYGDTLGVPTLQQPAADTEHLVGAAAGAGYQRAQSFRLAAARTLRAVRVLVRRVGAPGTGLQCGVHADAAGQPATTALGLGSAQAAAMPQAAGWQVFALAPALALSAATDYWLVLTTGAAADATNHYAAAGTAASVYADGTRADGTAAGAWTADGAGGDLAFALYTGEDSSERVRYDRLVTLRTTAAQAAGTTTGAAVDLGLAGPNAATVLLSVGDAGDPAGTVEVVVEHSDDGVAWAEATRGRSEGASLRDAVALTGVGRYLRLVSTVTGGDTPDVGTVAV